VEGWGNDIKNAKASSGIPLFPWSLEVIFLRQAPNIIFCAAHGSPTSLRIACKWRLTVFLWRLSRIKRCLVQALLSATPPLHPSSTQQILTSSLNLDITFILSDYHPAVLQDGWQYRRRLLHG